jgi:hypothetical protein
MGKKERNWTMHVWLMLKCSWAWISMPRRKTIELGSFSMVDFPKLFRHCFTSHTRCKPVNTKIEQRLQKLSDYGKINISQTILSTMNFSSQNDSLRGLPPIGRLRYSNETQPTLQYKTLEASSSRKTATFTLTNKLLWKFTFSSNINLKNNINKFNIVLILAQFFYKIIKVSSANCRWDTLKSIILR